MAAEPLVLVTNDDGVMAPGLCALARAVGGLGKVVVVAPDRDRSAVSHSLTMNRPVRVRQVDGPEVLSVDGTPTDCVMLAIHKLLPRTPDLVLSGINPGPNLGDDISYSGTVSAAVEAVIYGIPAIAFSQAGEAPFDFAAAAAVARRMARQVLGRGLPEATLLNVNVPGLPLERIEGLALTRQGRRVYRDAIQETRDPWGRLHYWIGGGTPRWDVAQDTDAALLARGFVSVTPIHLDLTNHQGLELLRQEWAGFTEDFTAALAREAGD